MTDMMKRNRKLRRVFLGIIAGMVLFMATIPCLHGQSQASATPVQQAALDPSERDSFVLISGVIGLVLEGVTDPGFKTPVRFATTGAMPRPDSAILEGGFHLVSTTAVAYERAGGEESGQTAGGVLLHRDQFGRYISTKYTANFRAAPDGSIVVYRTAVESIDPPVPKIFFYIVPAGKVTPALLKTRPVITLLDYVANSAVSRIKTSKGDRGEKDYYVFAFFMDRLAEDAKVELLISNQPSGFTGHGRDTRTFQDNGWHLAYTPCRFALDGTPEIFFKVLYTPGSRIQPDKRKQTLVAAFTSDSLVQQIQRLLTRRGYKPGPIDGMMGHRTREAIRQFQQERNLRVDGEPSIALLAALNTPDQLFTPVIKAKASTVDPSMVTKIQLGLANWGYNPGPADGILGERTWQAIKQFQRDQGLRVDGRPSAELAAMLVGSGRGSSTARSQFKSKMWSNQARPH